MPIRFEFGRGRVGVRGAYTGSIVSALGLSLALACGTPALAADPVLDPPWLAYTAPSPSGRVLPLRAAAPKPASHATPNAHAEGGIDTEHIFGITMGSDIGEKGELEYEQENFVGSGKRGGSYFAFAQLNQVKYTVTDNFRIAPGFSFDSHHIRGVEGFDNRQHASLSSASLEFRYKVLDRKVAPFGLTLHAQPGYRSVDETSGQRVRSQGAGFLALFDKEFIENRFWGAVNLGYGLGASRLSATGEWYHDSDMAVHVAASYQVAPGVVIGGETRYLRAYGGLALDHYRGDAVYVGPTFFWRVAQGVAFSGTVSWNVAGKAVDDPRRLDLADFERVQAMLRFNALF